MNSSSLGTVQMFRLVLTHTKSSSMDGHGVMQAELFLQQEYLT